jgi:hypothetical protein
LGLKVNDGADEQAHGAEDRASHLRYGEVQYLRYAVTTITRVETTPMRPRKVTASPLKE